MARVLIMLCAALSLVGCRNEDLAKADNRILCDLDGNAYSVRPNVGDTSFVKIQPDASAVCAKLKG